MNDPLLSIEEPNDHAAAFTDILGRACANTTGWYFDGVGDRPSQQAVMCSLYFVSGQELYGAWYALSYAELTWQGEQAYYRLVERTEQHIAAVRADTIASWEDPAYVSKPGTKALS